MDKKDISTASWPRVLGVIGAGLLIASLTVKDIFFDRSALTCIAIALIGVALSNSAGMRSVLMHKEYNGRMYEVSGNKFVWTPIAIVFALLAACFLIAAFMQLAF